MNGDLPLILASNSPRRRELLALGGWGFETRPADVDETPLAGEAPQDYVQRLAVEKARAVGQLLEEDSLIVAADTTVAMDGRIMGKPGDAAEAREMLTALRGRSHQVYSGIALLRSSDGEVQVDLASSEVPMRDFSDAEMEAYIESGDPFDKAGAYAIQNHSFAPVEGFGGCYANVMGLPLCHLVRNLQKWELAFSAEIPTACQAHLGYDCHVYNEVLIWEQ